MNKQQLNEEFSKKIANLYERMEAAYDEVAGALGFSCSGCPDNCCDSFFQHHTYLEWRYLREGLLQLPEERLAPIEKLARQYILESERILAQGERPQLMCPLNDKGLCGLYRHRLMICRMHGVPSVMTRPDGKKLEFPGCFRCQELVGDGKDAPAVERTELYKELAALEAELLGPRRQTLPRVKMTIAEMIVKEPSQIRI
jgi:Fe-S-cluster containining protein